MEAAESAEEGTKAKLFTLLCLYIINGEEVGDFSSFSSFFFGDGFLLFLFDRVTK